MNTKRTYFLLIFIFLCSFFAAAQNKSTNASKEAKPSSTSKVKKSPLERIQIGGNLSGGISNDYYFLTAAPRLSMNVTSWFVPGVTIAYMYSLETGITDPDPTIGTYSVASNTYGAGVFTDFYPIRYVFGHVEYQHLWYAQKIKGTSDKYTDSDHFLLMGAGAKVPVGGKTSVFASISFNVLNNEKSEYYMYKNPIYSIGVDVGL